MLLLKNPNDAQMASLGNSRWRLLPTSFKFRVGDLKSHFYFYYFYSLFTFLDFHLFKNVLSVHCLITLFKTYILC